MAYSPKDIQAARRRALAEKLNDAMDMIDGRLVGGLTEIVIHWSFTPNIFGAMLGKTPEAPHRDNVVLIDEALWPSVKHNYEKQGWKVKTEPRKGRSVTGKVEAVVAIFSGASEHSGDSETANLAVPDWVTEEIKATWNAARECGSQAEAFRLFERMTERLGYGRHARKDCPSLAHKPKSADAESKEQEK